MKRKVLIITLICCSCQSDMENDLLGEKLIGKWEVMKFAYSDNNQNITNETLIPNKEKSANINDYQMDMSLEKKNLELDTTLLFISWFWGYYYYSIDINSMKFLESKPIGGYIYKIPTDTQNDIQHTLTNTQSYIIKGKELRIYFTGLKEKNVLILKKIKQ